MGEPVRSMTGYGRGECMTEQYAFVVELKSVNHRYNDVNIKLPRSLNQIEDKIKKRILQDVFRGKLDVFITMQNLGQDDTAVRLNNALANGYVNQIRALETLIAEQCTDIISLVAKFPDVIITEKKDIANDEIWSAISPALEKALKSFIYMRIIEGENLKRDILKKGAYMGTLVEQIKKIAPLVVVDYQQKLQARLKELLKQSELDQQRIATEVALFADKCCIDEELTRLQSHLMQLEEILQNGGQVGRKLDFLAQEMNREANTIASKANHVHITKTTIELKSEIEKIREQIQNLE